MYFGILSLLTHLESDVRHQHASIRVGPYITFEVEVDHLFQLIFAMSAFMIGVLMKVPE